MRFLITGADGMVGSDLRRLLDSEGYEFLAADRSTLDVANRVQAREVIGSYKPDVVIHTAAVTNADKCQLDPLLGYSVNTVGTQNVALAAEAAGAALVYVSSCGVFDGTKMEPYTEFDKAEPRTHHHRSKLLGEQAAVNLCRKTYIVRPGWIFGGSVRHGKNFVAARYREALANPELVSAKDRFGSPTYSFDFARQILHLVRSEAYGLYHTANAGWCTRYEYVSDIIRLLGLPNSVEPVTSERFPRPAPSPVCEALDNTCLRLQGLNVMRPWQEAMEEYIQTRFLPEIHSPGDH